MHTGDVGETYARTDPYQLSKDWHVEKKIVSDQKKVVYLRPATLIEKKALDAAVTPKSSMEKAAPKPAPRMTGPTAPKPAPPMERTVISKPAPQTTRVSIPKPAPQTTRTSVPKPPPLNNRPVISKPPPIMMEGPMPDAVPARWGRTDSMPAVEFGMTRPLPTPTVVQEAKNRTALPKPIALRAAQIPIPTAVKAAPAKIMRLMP